MSLGIGCGIWAGQTAATSGLGGGGAAGSGWNPADKNAGIALSGTNNTVALFSSSQWNNVRGTQSQSSGKLYLEGLIGGTLNTNGVGIGVGTAIASLTSNLGGDANSAGTYTNGFTRGANSTGSNLATSVVGDVLGLAIDFTAAKVWFSKNNVWNGDPVAGTGGYTLPAGTLFPMGSGWDSASGTVTLRTAAGTQSYSPPTGYSPWG